MRRLVVAIIALSAIMAIGCGSPTEPDPIIVVTSPREGQVFNLGDTITISWRCEECEGIQAKHVRVLLDPEGKNTRYEIDTHFLSGSLIWRPGEGKDYWYPQPGLFRITVWSETIWVSADTGYPEATGESGVFKLVR